MPTPTAAANAYTALARLTDPGRTLAKSDGGGDAGASFGSLLKTALGAVVDAGRKSDAQSQSLAAGKANVVDVVTAVAETEVAIESLVAVRDRVVQAYDEIMKMPI
jgi:flagellar hook-basal body complex protein FliE